MKSMIKLNQQINSKTNIKDKMNKELFKNNNKI